MPRHDAGPQALNKGADPRASTLEAALTGSWPGLAVEWRESIGSTSTELTQRIRRAALTPREASSAGGSGANSLVLIANEQTQGRGRMGRQWQSEPGASLTFSLAVPLSAIDWSGLSLAIGVALAESLGRTYVQEPRLMLKWPNDLWLMGADGLGRKLGGVLIEGLASPRGDRFAVIGIGINLRPMREATPPASSLSHTPPSVGRASLSELWPQVHADDMALEALLLALPALLSAVRTFEAHGFKPFVERFSRLDLLGGRAVRTFGFASTAPGAQPQGNRMASADAEGGGLQGTAIGVNERGALLLRVQDAVHAITSGEVSVRLDPGEGSANPGASSPLAPPDDSNASLSTRHDGGNGPDDGIVDTRAIATSPPERRH